MSQNQFTWSEFEKNLKSWMQIQDANVILHECKRVELNAFGSKNMDYRPIPKSFFCAFLLSYLIIGDLNNARFLWKRIPNYFKKKELSLIWELGKHMWLRNYPNVYKTIDTTQWSSDLIPMIKCLCGAYRRRTLELLARAYSSIKVVDVCQYVGMMKPQDAAAEMLKFGWKVEGEYAFPVEKKKSKLDIKSQGLKLVEDLTKKTIFLELNNE